MRPGSDKVARAVVLRPPERWLEERRKSGADRWDEVWEGVLHMVPPPSSWHQRFGLKLARVLAPIAEAQGLESTYETGLYRPDTADTDFRVPDLMFVRPERISPRGVEGGADLVIELLSEGDESREKLAFYVGVGVREALLVDPDTREFELYSLRSDRFFAAMPDERGAIRSAVLGVSFAKVAGPRISLVWSGGTAQI